MTNRDRWIIYPLLFLAIGLGLRCGIILQDLQQRLHLGGARNVIEADTIQCKNIEAAHANFGQMQIIGPGGKPVVVLAIDPTTKSGVIETGTAEGLKQAELKSDPLGGALTLFTTDAKKIVALGSDGDAIRLFSAEIENGKLVPKSTALVARVPPSTAPKTEEKKDSAPPKEENKSNDSGKQSTPPTN